MEGRLRTLGRNLSVRREGRRRLQRLEPRFRKTVLGLAALPHPHAQVEPGGLAGDRVGVGIALAVAGGRQEVANRVVQQEAPVGLGGIVLQAPRTVTLADRVPGPHGIRVDALHQPGLPPNAAVGALDPDPVVISDA